MRSSRRRSPEARGALLVEVLPPRGFDAASIVGRRVVDAAAIRAPVLLRFAGRTIDDVGAPGLHDRPGQRVRSKATRAFAVVTT